MNSNQNSHKRLYNFDVRDPGNFEARLREMMAAQGTSELNTEKIQRKRKERESDTMVINVKRKKLTYSEKIARLRQDMEAGGFKYQRVMETTDAGPQTQKKKKKRERYSEKFARLRMGMMAEWVLYHRDETVQERTEVKERRREEEREIRSVPFTSRAIPEFSSVDRSLFIGGPPSPTTSSSGSEISLLDAQLNDLLGFEAVQSEQKTETDEKKKRKREEEDDGEEKGKKTKREDPEASSTSQASRPVLTAKQRLRLRLAEEAQVFHNISQKDADAKPVDVPVTGGQPSPAPSSSASNVPLLDAQLNDLLGFEAFESEQRTETYRTTDASPVDVPVTGEQPRPGPSRSPSMIAFLDALPDDLWGFEAVESERQPCPGPSSSPSLLHDLFSLEDYLDYLLDVGPAN